MEETRTCSGLDGLPTGHSGKRTWSSWNGDALSIPHAVLTCNNGGTNSMMHELTCKEQDPHVPFRTMHAIHWAEALHPVQYNAAPKAHKLL